MSYDPPNDRARELAKEALAQINRLDDLAKFVGEDATEAQELHISLCLRNYAIEQLKALSIEPTDKAKAREELP